MANKVKLARWRKHLKRAAARGITLAQYARENRLSRHTLYAASQQERAETVAERIEAGAGLQRKGKTLRSAFIAVRLPEVECAAEWMWSNGAAMLQARLPNGVQVRIEVGGDKAGTAQPPQPPQPPQGSSEPAPWAQVLQALAGLPCSR